MEQSIRQYFFSDKNVKLIYNMIQNFLFKKYKFNINNNNTFKNDLINIFNSVFQQKNVLNINLNNINASEYIQILNKKVLDISIGYFSKYIEKNIKTNKITDRTIETSNLVNFRNKVGERPNRPTNDNYNINKKYEELQKSRQINFKNNQQQIDWQSNNPKIELNNVKKTFEKIEKERSEEFLKNSNNDLNNNAWLKPNDQHNSIKRDVNEFLPGLNENTNNSSKVNEFLPGLNENTNNSSKVNEFLPGLNENTNNSSKVNEFLPGLNENTNNSSKVNKFPRLNENNKSSKVNEFLPGLNENELNINDQFKSLINDNKNIQTFKNKFENISINDKLKQIQNERSKPIIEIINNTNNTKFNKSNILDTKIIKTQSLSENINPILKVNNTSANVSSINSNLILNNTTKLAAQPISTINSNSILNNTNKLSPISTIKSNSNNIATYNLIINSYDRQWYGIINSTGDNIFESNYNNRYFYVIHFSPQSHTSVKIPIYDNNKYVARSINNVDDQILLEQGKKKLNNKSEGFMYNGKHYKKYNPNKPNGNIIDYETKYFKSQDDNISIDSNFKNIISIKVKRLILPSYNSNTDIINNDNELTNIPIGSKNYPYIILKANEFNANTVNTTKYNNNILAKVNYDKEFSNKTNNLKKYNRGYIYYINNDNDIVQFKKPLNKLNKLSINILKPNGDLYSDVKDDLIINNISCDNLKHIKITLNKWVPIRYFELGDKIIFKNIVIKNNINIQNELKTKIISYLNDNECYINKLVNNNDEPNTDFNIKTIFINNKIINIDSNGNNVYYINTLFNNLNIAGFILNINHQHHLILEIKCLEYNL